MAIGDFENILSRTAKVQEIEDYASAWWDMRSAAQMIHGQIEFDKTPANYFTRRSIWDGSVVTYARCFTSGRRDTDILALVAELDDEMRDTHDVVMHWRNQHVAHRVDSTLETIVVTMLWGNWGENLPVVRVRIASQPQPDDLRIEDKFARLASTLANMIWERYLYPLQQELLDALGSDELVRMKQATIVMHEDPSKLPKDVMSVNLNIGSIPPPIPTKPTPTPRKPKRGPRKGR